MPPVAAIDAKTERALKDEGFAKQWATTSAEFREEMQNFPGHFGASDSADVYLRQNNEHRAIVKQIKSTLRESDDAPTLKDCLAALKTWNVSDFVKGVYRAVYLVVQEGQFSSTQVEEFVSQIDALTKSKNPYINGYQAFLKGIVFFSHKKFQDLENIQKSCTAEFNAVKNSHVPHLKYLGISGVADVMAHHSNWKDALAFVESSQKELPREYEPKLKLKICGWWSSHKERSALRLYQIPLLEELIKSEDLKLKAKATIRLAHLYQYPCGGSFEPQKALLLFEDLLTTQSAYINRYRVLDCFIRLLSWGSVKDDAKSFKFCQEILDNRESIGKHAKWIVHNATNEIIHLYADSTDQLIKNQQLAYEMAKQIFYDKSMPSYLRGNVFGVLITSMRRRASLNGGSGRERQ